MLIVVKYYHTVLVLQRWGLELVALTPRLKTTVPDLIGIALLAVYQVGLVATAGALIVDHMGRCTAVFNCMVLLAADLFRAMIWPLYWSVHLLANLLA